MSAVVGDRLGPLVVVPTRRQLFMFSAATWNRHHVHYDPDAARAEGLPDVVVHRALLGDFLARLVVAWAGPDGAVRALGWKVLRSATPDRALVCSGEVTAVTADAAGTTVRCVLRITDPEGETVATGEATVVLS